MNSIGWAEKFKFLVGYGIMMINKIVILAACHVVVTQALFDYITNKKASVAVAFASLWIFLERLSFETPLIS